MTKEEIVWHYIDASDLPDWKDGGFAELLYSDGSVVSGEMTIDEHWTGEEEIPFAEFVSNNGDHLSIFDCVAWRIIKPYFRRSSVEKGSDCHPSPRAAAARP